MQQPKLLLEGKYEILSKIREGGMGTIYRVRHRLLDEVRVIKIMQPHVVADADLKRRFLEEAKTAIRLKHPNICTIHDFAVDDDGTAYLVMEMIDGVNLADLLKSRGLPGVALTIEIAHQALLALGYLHRKGVIHRDIAPDNLMLAHDEEGGPVIKLIDLGIAKVTNRSMDMTATGVFLGKLKYASPEQYGTLPAGERLDGRSDLYGMGVVLYELLTGMRPFVGESPAELLRAHLFTEPKPFAESDPQGKVPEELRVRVLKALQKKREDRYATAEDFDRDILDLRERFAGPESVRNAMEELSNIRSTQPASQASVTPSAQDRLDRQFGPHTTPSPSLPNLSILPGTAFEKTTQALPSPRERETGRPTEGLPDSASAGPYDKTAIDPLAAAGRASTAPTVAAEGRSPARPAKVASPSDRAVPVRPEKPGRAAEPALGRRAGATVPLILVLAAAAGLLIWRPWSRTRVASEETAARPAPTEVALAEPTAPAAPSPLPTALPTAAPESAEAPAPARPFEQAARESRASTTRVRHDADQARARELAPSTYRRAAAAQAQAERLEESRDDAGAKKAFDAAARLFSQAEATARAEAARQAVPTPLRVAELPSAIVRPTAAPAVPTAVPPPPTAPPVTRSADVTRVAVADTEAPPTVPAVSRGGPSEDPVRETVRLYERAWSRFDSKLYRRVYPSGVDAFELAIKNLQSQYVRIEIRRVDFDASGARAEVHGRETIVATPKSGTEVQNEGEVTLHLQKSGDHWIIAGRN